MESYLENSLDYNPNDVSKPDYKKVDLYDDEYLNGATHFRNNAIKALEKQKAKLEKESVYIGQSFVIKEITKAIEIIKNLKA